MRIRVLGFLLVSVLFAAVAAAQSADLYVIKSGPATATEGSNITYTVMIGNGGPDDAANATLTDTLPAGGTFVSESQTGGTTIFACTTPNVGDPGGTVSCTAATFPAGETATFQITVTAAAGTAGTTLINSAKIASDTPDNNPENDTSIAGTDIAGGNLADVAILKSGPTAAPPNSDVSYTITVTNNGPNDASTVSFTDTLPNSVPAGNAMTFVSFTQNTGPTFNCGSPSTTTTCSIATFPNGSTATFTLVGHIPNSAPSGATYTNQVSLTSANDPNPENDTSSTTVSVSTTDVGVTKSAPATAVAGATFNYTITLSNGGPDTAVNASFNDPLPPGINFVSVTQNTGPTAACSTTTNDVACDVPLLGNGASAQFTIAVKADPATPNGTVVTNTVTATSESFDTNPNNNSSSAATTINANADMAIAKSGPASATPGVAFAYTIVVTNNGPSTATSVNWVDVLPAGTTFVSLNQVNGPTFNCTTGATVTCSLASMAPSTSAQFTLTVLPASSATGALSNTANVASATTDTNPNNNSSTAPTALIPSADLGVTKTGPVTGNVGQPLAFTITVTNGGPSDAANVSLTDALPASLTFVSMMQTGGTTTFACSGTSTVTCTAATMPPGTATFTLTTTVNSAGTSSNTATVSTTTTDPNPANNSSTQPFSTFPVADLAVTKTGPAVTSSGANISYTITLTNNGPSQAASVVLTDPIPANTTFVSMNQTGGTPAFNCTGTTTVTCTAATMNPGESATFNLTVLVNMGPTVVNTATASSATLDLTPANNSATATTPVAFGGNVPTLSPFALALLALALALIALKR